MGLRLTRARASGPRSLRSLAKPNTARRALAQEPTRRPKKLKKSPAPFVHAATKAMRLELWDTYAWFVAAYRDAAEKLRAGDGAPPFPPGCTYPGAVPSLEKS